MPLQNAAPSDRQIANLVGVNESLVFFDPERFGNCEEDFKHKSKHTWGSKTASQ